MKKLFERVRRAVSVLRGKEDAAPAVNASIGVEQPREGEKEGRFETTYKGLGRLLGGRDRMRFELLLNSGEALFYEERFDRDGKTLASFGDERLMPILEVIKEQHGGDMANFDVSEVLDDEVIARAIIDVISAIDGTGGDGHEHHFISSKSVSPSQQGWKRVLN